MDAAQAWSKVAVPPSKDDRFIDKALRRSTCGTCHQHSYWVEEALVWPEPRVGPLQADDLPEDLVVLYDEARLVGVHSPRAAAALLRLLVERLLAKLGFSDRTLDGAIKSAHDAGQVTGRMVDAMHSVRIGGNRGIHAGQIALSGEDDPAMLDMLFRLVNHLAEATFGVDRINDAFRDLPKSGKTGASKSEDDATS